MNAFDIRTAARCLALAALLGGAGIAFCRPDVAVAQSTPAPAATPAFDTTDIHFQSAGTDLIGRLFVPRGLTHYPLVILVQGSDYDDANASIYWRLIANGFAKRGIASFSFNKRGVGGSAGAQTDNFETQAGDVAAACNAARLLPGVDTKNVGYYGISQAAWIVPRAIAVCPSAFTVLVSAAGVAPARSDDYYLTGQFHTVGMSEAESVAALQLHDALAAYYRNGVGYRRTQALVAQAQRSGMLAKFRKIDFRDDVPASGRIPTPVELAAQNRKDPSTYEFYRDPNTWSEPAATYAGLTSPLLLVYGGMDEKVPVEQSLPIFQTALRANQNPDVTIHIFEAADHDIQIGPRILPGYREYMADWVTAHLVTP